MQIITNYKSLPTFEVAFHDDNLPHLLGLQYVSDVKFASGILRNIDSGKMTSKSIMRHPNFAKQDIRNRILLYPFLYDVFIEQKIKVCVPTINMIPNSMKLSCVFFENRNKEEVILGLRRDNRDGIFKLATLHSSKHKKYCKMKCSKVKQINWNE